MVSDTKHRQALLSRDDIEAEYGITRRWLELAALVPDKGPPMIRLSRRMIRYQRGAFEDWLVARTVTSTSQEAGLMRRMPSRLSRQHTE